MSRNDDKTDSQLFLIFRNLQLMNAIISVDDAVTSQKPIKNNGHIDQAWHSG